MPYSPLSDGSTLTAAHLLSNVYDQVISQVTSGTRPSSPPEGQMIYETDTDLFRVWNGTDWAPFGGLGAWISYAPSLTQSGAVANTATYARYMKFGRTVILSNTLTVTGAGTGNNAISISVPHTAASVGAGNMEVGTGHIYAAGPTHPGIVVLNTTTTFCLLDSTTTTTGLLLGQTGTTFGSALAAGNIINIFATYESAA